MVRIGERQERQTRGAARLIRRVYICNMRQRPSPRGPPKQPMEASLNPGRAPCVADGASGTRVVLKHAVEELGARCIDGSPPVYYISEGRQHNKWMIYQEVRTRLRFLAHSRRFLSSKRPALPHFTFALLIRDDDDQGGDWCERVELVDRGNSRGWRGGPLELQQPCGHVAWVLPLRGRCLKQGRHDQGAATAPFCICCFDARS